MKKQILTTALAMFAVTPMFSVHAADGIKAKVATVPSDVNAAEQSGESKIANPFTGDTQAFDKNVQELKLAKQRRSLAEARLGEQSALSQIAKLKEPTINAQLRPTVGVLPSTVGPAGSPQLIKKSFQRSASSIAANNRAPVVDSLPISQGPKLIGVTEAAGKKYALFENNGKSLTIQEGESANGINVGAINGQDVIVNGVPKRVVVGAQEVAYDADVPLSSERRINGVASATTFNPVNRDMSTLRLPTVNDAKILTGPQPLPIPQGAQFN